MRLTTLCLSLAVVCVPGAAFAQWGFTFDDQQDWTVTFSPARVIQAIEGDFLWDEGGVGTTLDVESVLDMDDSEEFAGWFNFQGAGDSVFRLGYLPLDFGGEALLTANQTVNGTVYTAGDRVASEMELQNYELAYGYKFRLGRHLMIAPVIQLNVVDGLLRTQDLDLAGSEVTEDFVLPIALTGLRVEVSPIPRWVVFAEIKGFAASNWGELESARIADGEFGMSFSLTRNVVMTGRYRLSDFSFDVSDTEVDLDLSGFSFSVDMRF